MDKPLVEMNQGKLLGTTSLDMDGNEFYSFRGIPYAKPPIGNLRFKAPLPPSPWQGIFHATKNGSCCYSMDLFKQQMTGSEDCLNLSVYTSSLPTSSKTLMPVMLWIHGGGFLTGSNDSKIYGPEFLIPERVVVVTINYRLGLLGFLSLDDPSAGVPGNAGFKDMVMALKWVNTNIRHFNGDPNNVTIFGESVGGAAVHLLMLSSMARGLFHKAIAQSGSALNAWSRAKKADSELYKAFNWQGKNDKEFVKYLQALPVETILINQAKLPYILEPATINYYGLTIERPAAEQRDDPFICEDPLDIILSKEFSDVPFIIGYNNLEGLVVNTYEPKRVIKALTEFESNVPHFLGYKVEECKKLGQKIKEYYFGDKEPLHHRQNFYEMVTDHSFMHGVYLTARQHVSKMSSPVYFYRMSLTTSLKFLQAAMTVDKDKGAAHGDDVAYLFKTIFTPPLSPTSLEYRSIKKFVKLWTNFAYYGNPTPPGSMVVWKNAIEDQLGFLEIDKELKFCEKVDEKNLDFWEKLYCGSSVGQKFYSKTKVQ